MVKITYLSIALVSNINQKIVLGSRTSQMDFFSTKLIFAAILFYSLMKKLDKL